MKKERLNIFIDDSAFDYGKNKNYSGRASDKLAGNSQTWHRMNTALR
jgi:hypothetical protein